MKKSLGKFIKILVLVAMIFSDLISPIKVLADVINTPSKGDVGINNTVDNNGNNTTVSVGSIKEQGGVKVTKTVSKTETEGKYEVKFRVEGNNVENTTTTKQPVYVVVIFDRSNSMENVCVGGWTGDYYGKGSGEHCLISSNELKPFWKNAVMGAKTFATTLLSHISHAQIALVTYADESKIARVFANSDLNNGNFGEPNGGTNIAAGLNDAKTLLDNVSDAKKYAVLIGDGVPEVTGDLDADKNAAIKAAKELKDSGVEVFTIGYESFYGLSEDAESTLKQIANDNNHYSRAGAGSVAKKFSDIAESIKTVVPAGTDAILKDNIGTGFNVIPNSNITIDNDGNVTANIGDITEDGKEVSFYVEIDGDNVNDWVNVNEGFVLSYNDYDNKDVDLSYSESERQPQVYWERNTYGYTINYYKDSISLDNLIGSDNGNAYKDSVITLSDVEANSKLPNGYELNSVSPESLVITNNSSNNVINVLYTKKELTYKVEYYFQNIDNDGYTKDNELSNDKVKASYGDSIVTSSLNNISIPEGYHYNDIKTNEVNDSEYTITDNSTVIKLYYDRDLFEYKVRYLFEDLNGNYSERMDIKGKNISDVKYGTEVLASSYELVNVPEGFILNRVMTNGNNMGKYVITDNDNVINIYYDRSNYKLNVNYSFNGVFDSVYNYSKDAIYGTTENSIDYVLERINPSYLSNKIITDNKKYFLDPNRNNDSIVIGTDNNCLNVYYISTEFDNSLDKKEYITKSSDTEIISNTNSKVKYTIDYGNYIKNIRNGDKVVVTIIDKLPSSIDINNSDLNGGIYDSENNTITWYIESYVMLEDDKEVSEDYSVNINSIVYEVKYDNYLDFNGNKLVNNVTGKTSVLRDEVVVLESSGKNDNASVDVKINSMVIATYKDEEGNELSDSVVTEGLVGSKYSTDVKSFYGYTLKSIPSNKDGNYLNNSTIYVNYIYTKNDGTSSEEIYKDGLEVVGSINDTFNYTISYNAKIEDYYGKAYLTITDILPYEIDINKSKISNNCKYDKDSNTIVCKYEVSNRIVNNNINGINNDIDESKILVFDIEEDFELYYINIDNKEVTNKVVAELSYGKTTKTSDSECTTLVEEGNVIVNYITKDGTKLTDSVILKGLVGTKYVTDKKEFDKYSFIEVKGDVEGTYTNDDIEVTYVYDFTILPPQTGIENNYFMYINYIFALFAVIVAYRTYRTIKNS